MHGTMEGEVRERVVESSQGAGKLERVKKKEVWA